MQFINCTTCKRQIAVHDIKYHTADQTKVFCDAYCSHEYHQSLRETENVNRPKT